MMRTPARILWIVIATVMLYELSLSIRSSHCIRSNDPDQSQRRAADDYQSEQDVYGQQTASSWRSRGSRQGSRAISDSEVTSRRFPIQFPKRVWQTASEDGKIKWAKSAQTWKDLEDWDYTFLSDDEADAFVDATFAHSPSIPTFWHKVQSHVIRADLLRYLIMLAEGGIYSDIDTTCLVHPDSWIPSNIDISSINAVVGIEYDDTTYPIFVWPISFSQWTLLAKPNHPIFQLAVTRVISNLEFLARRKFAAIDIVDVNKKEVLAATGPGMITDVVLQVIRDQGVNATWETFHDITEPTLFGDILVLPINAFAGNQKHSHAGDPTYGKRLVQHHFARSWYVRPQNAV